MSYWLNNYTFQPFINSYGAPLAPPLQFFLTPIGAQLQDMQDAPRDGVEGQSHPLEEVWASFRDTILGRSVEVALVPLRRHLLEPEPQGRKKTGSKKKKKDTSAAASAAFVDLNTDPRAHCWLRVFPDANTDACRAGYESQNWQAHNASGDPISTLFNMWPLANDASYDFTNAKAEPKPWRFVEQRSGRSIELRIGWAYQPDYPANWSESTPPARAKASHRRSTAAEYNLAQFKEGRAWKSKYE
jgi:hypothetical protein